MNTTLSNGARVKFSIHSESDRIPHIIHGTSANSMFWLIKGKKFMEDGGDIQQPEQYENSGHFSYPFDLDDFSRCVNAANIFKYTESDIAQGIASIEHFGLKSKGWKYLLDNFLEMKEKFETADWEPVKSFLVKLNDMDED